MVLMLPKGSYQDSCYSCKYDGSDLKCTCLYGSHGAYRNSSLPDAGSCRPEKGTTVANIDGHLKCEGIPCAVGDGVANSSGMCEVQRSDVRNFFNGTTPAASCQNPPNNQIPLQGFKAIKAHPWLQYQPTEAENVTELYMLCGSHT